MIDIEARIAEALRERPDPAVHIERLTARATADGRRRRRQALFGRVVVGVAVIAAGAAVVATLPATSAHREPPAGPGPAGPGVDRPTTLPSADGAPSAAERPSAVGSDAGIVRFDLDPTGLAVTSWTFHTEPTAERIEFSTSPGGDQQQIWFDAEISSNRDRAGRYHGGQEGMGDGQGNAIPSHREVSSRKVTVHGRPATLRTYDPIQTAEGGPMGRLLRVSWEPVRGLYADVEMRNSTDEALVIRAASGLRFDRAQHCASPVKLAIVPAGATWTTCYLVFGIESYTGRYDWLATDVELRLADGTPVAVSISTNGRRSFQDADTEGNAKPFDPNRTVGGRPARWQEEIDTLSIVDIGPFKAQVYPGGRRDGSLSEATATEIGAAITPHGDPDDQSTWALRPVA